MRNFNTKIPTRHNMISIRDRYPHIPEWCDICYNGNELNTNLIFYKWYNWVDTHVSVKDWCRVCGLSEEDTVMWVLRYGDTLPSYIDQL